MDSQRTVLKVFMALNLVEEIIFFTLHNDPSSVEASIESDSRFDSGKLLFKWNRSYDPDADSLISEYFTSDLYYRIEVFESVNLIIITYWMR